MRHAMTEQSQIQELQQRIQDLEQRLIQTQKMSTVGQLASSITHEFNNILTTVINYAKLGLRHKDAANRDKAFDRILSAGQRASKITNGLLAYARKGNDRREPIDLVTLIQDVLVLVEKDLMMHRVRLQTNFPDHPVCVLNVVQIQQVLLNLIVNARQAMENGGMLTVSVRSNAESRMAEISVRDTGSGIPAEKLRKIFEPFFTTKIADAQGQGGTGLGLALARQVIESHLGRIRVESAPGQGTTFILKLPLNTEITPRSIPVEAVTQRAG